MYMYSVIEQKTSRHWQSQALPRQLGPIQEATLKLQVERVARNSEALTTMSLWLVLIIYMLCYSKRLTRSLLPNKRVCTLSV